MALVDQDHVFQGFFLLPEIILQEFDHFAWVVALEQGSDINDPLAPVFRFHPQVVLRLDNGLFCHAAASINHASQFFLNEQFLHLKLDGLSLGMNIPLDIPLETSTIFFLARVSSAMLRVV